MRVGVEVKGAQRILEELTPQLYADAMRRFFQRATIYVQGEARKRAPVDRGQLRNSIITEVDDATPPLYGKVGVLHAPFGTPLGYAAHAMEFGTGYRAEGPGASHRRHWPPAAALDLWASRHGFESGAVVAMIIGKYGGGLRPRRFLRGAFEDSLGAIRGYLAQVGDDIQRKWGSR